MTNTLVHFGSPQGTTYSTPPTPLVDEKGQPIEQAEQ